jgi:hypothetical protein
MPARDRRAAAVGGMACILVSVVGVRGVGMGPHTAARSVRVRPVAVAAVAVRSVAVVPMTGVAVMPMTRVAERVMPTTRKSVGVTCMTAVSVVFAGITRGAAVPVRLGGTLKGALKGCCGRLFQRPSDGEGAADLSGLRGRVVQVRALRLLRVLLLRVQVRPRRHAKYAALACGQRSAAAAHLVKRAVRSFRPAPRQQPLLVQRKVCVRVGGAGARARLTAPVAPAAPECREARAAAAPAATAGATAAAVVEVEPVAVLINRSVAPPVSAVHAADEAEPGRRRV